MSSIDFTQNEAEFNCSSDVSECVCSNFKSNFTQHCFASHYARIKIDESTSQWLITGFMLVMVS